jgi:cation transport ATPase
MDSPKLKEDDIVLVKPDKSIPADEIVIEGKT